MPSFFDFLQESKNSSPIAIGMQTARARIGSELRIAGLSERKADSFLNDVSNLAHSDGFLKPASDEIGNPKEGESEEQFVRRAKTVLSAQLKKVLRK